MNVVDSSGWLEYFADGSNADFFAPAILDEANLVVPTICMYEVFKRLALQRGKDAALQAMGVLYRGQLAPLSDEIALQAALLSLEHRLPLADSVILATAHTYEARLWTQDEHFKDLAGVEYVEKRQGESMENLEKQFHHAMMGGNEKAKLLGYNATYFQRMIDQYGSLETAKRLLAKPVPQEGLMKLWELGCLDESMEALVIQERFHSLFTEEEIAEARRRLDELGYFK